MYRNTGYTAAAERRAMRPTLRQRPAGCPRDPTADNLTHPPPPSPPSSKPPSHHHFSGPMGQPRRPRRQPPRRRMQLATFVYGRCESTSASRDGRLAQPQCFYDISDHVTPRLRHDRISCGGMQGVSCSWSCYAPCLAPHHLENRVSYRSIYHCGPPPSTPEVIDGSMQS